MAKTTAVEAHFDIVVVGGGLVGVSMLHALAGTSFRVAFIEAVSYRNDSQPSFDDRIIALSQSSRRIFQNLALWQDIESQSCPIRHIHVSEKGRFGATRIHAQDYQLDALGYVVTAKQLGRALIKDLSRLKNLSIYQPATVESLEPTPQGYRIILDTRAPQDHSSSNMPFDLASDSPGKPVSLTCSLLIAADGDQSTIRQLSGIPVRRVAYQQNAIVANIKCELDHQHVAYERFTRHGPLALLPMREKTMGIVWTHTKETVEQRLALSDSEFCQQLQAAFGRRLGQLHSIGKRIQFPLALSYPTSSIAQRLVLLGNAAHTLHPVAGQGFNLGMRDVAVLAQLLEEAAAQGNDPGDASLLQRYQDWRQSDHHATIRFTHGLVLGFSNSLAPMTIARGAGLVLTDVLTPLKRYLANASMGLGLQTMPRLMLNLET